MSLTVGSLFTGIGGVDLGLERAGMTVRWQSEIDPYCCRVLAKHWPDTPNLGDITSVDWATVEPVDVICGGYPCQPFSVAGSRQGTNDARHLWPYFADAIRVLRPRYALLENVPGHLSLGFGDVIADLAACGYDANWDCIPAAAVGAPHLRDRLFTIATQRNNVADPDGHHACERRQRAPLSGRSAHRSDDRDGSERDLGQVGMGCAGEVASNVADANSTPGNATWTTSKTLFRPETLERFRRRARSNGGGHTWTTEPDVGRVAHGIPDRLDRLRALGNAVVPQVAQYIGELITTHAKANT